ncbi:hypothetical protein TeGR_g12673 [Tetraparma gracilis]|uniref:Uncharacterized protein n=1 Tax=Tetraparma gracilis TaxID=2962635 RepID=A0ABQ6MIC8_9STRA|nr:hypothetical protein TeGR_g12673 [Tetraparma gracilis]
MSAFLPLLCPCLLPFLHPRLAAHLSDLRSLDDDVPFHRRRQGMFAGGSTEEVTLTIKTDKGPSLAALLGDESGAPPSEHKSDGLGPLLTALVVLPVGTGKGKAIQLLDIGNVKLETASGRTSLLIRGRTNDLLFQGHTDALSGGGENYAEVVRRAVAFGQQRLLAGKPEAESSTSVVGGMNAVEKGLYFSKREREIEAKRKKAQERKQKFMRDSGGLKYTAIAMANMADK